MPLQDRLTTVECAYLAGLFDGEGCVGYYKRKGSRSKYSFLSTVMISQSAARLMTWLRETIGFGTIYSRPGKKNIEYHWETNKKADVVEFLAAIRPYLILKGEQVDILLDHLRAEGVEPLARGKVTPEVFAKREWVSNELKVLKRVNLMSVN